MKVKASMKIKKTDYHRVLLTEVLPYETPLWFSNKGIYNYYVNDKPENALPLVKALFDLEKSTKVFSPYKYKIKKNIDSFRVLSIIHPLKQKHFIPFYQKYDNLILSFCQKSPVSIRYPKRVATKFSEGRLQKRVKSILDGEIEVDVDGFSDQEKFSSSYFSYAKFPFLYKFFDSYLFHNLEKKFSHISRFDISNCFNSVYTHSVTWSVKDKEIVKETMEYHSFEAYFDKLMQATKSMETNGILIGPEVSRIFAEIILQKIDLNIISEIEKRLQLKHDVHYSLRRYIDDYFTFSNSEDISREIRLIAEEMLEHYNFHLNPKKNRTLSIPYVSEISIAKSELSAVLENINDLLDKVINTEDTEQLKIRTSDKAVQIIHDIKSIVVKCHIDVDTISTFLLVRLRGIIFKLFVNMSTLELTEKKKERIGNFIFLFMDVFFYFLSVDTRPRSTFILSQIVSEVMRQKIFVDDMILNDVVIKKIADEMHAVINKIATREGLDSLELLNLLYIQKQLGESYQYDHAKFLKITNLKDLMKDNKIGYFQIITVLAYCGKHPEYSLIKDELCEYVIGLYQSDRKMLDRADGFCLLFDFIACPYIDDTFKHRVAVAAFALIGKKPNQNDREAIIKYLRKRQWFASWEETPSLESLLEKLELNPCY